GRPLSRTTLTAAATDWLTSSPTPSGVSEKATSMALRIFAERHSCSPARPPAAASSGTGAACPRKSRGVMFRRTAWAWAWAIFSRSAAWGQEFADPQAWRTGPAGEGQRGAGGPLDAWITLVGRYRAKAPRCGLGRGLARR